MHQITRTLGWCAAAAGLMLGASCACAQDTSFGVATVHTTPERVLALVRIEGPKMGKVLKAAGVAPD